MGDLEVDLLVREFDGHEDRLAFCLTCVRIYSCSFYLSSLSPPIMSCCIPHILFLLKIMCMCCDPAAFIVLRGVRQTSGLW